MDYMTVEIGGTAYRLAYTTNALCQMEDRADGVSLAVMAQRKSNQFRRLMLWAALVTDQPETTLEVAGGLLDAYRKEQGRDAIVGLIADLQRHAGLIDEIQETDEKNVNPPQGD